MSVLALDIGGANIKWAHADGAAGSMPFALWQAPQALSQRLADLLAEHGRDTLDTLLVTMTAELCDCFETKAAGVHGVLEGVREAVRTTAPGAAVHVWTTEGCFVTPQDARHAPLRVAAANWHALATWAAGHWPQGRSLLIDIGSTTSDLIPLTAGRCAARGRTDTERLATGELIYLGSTRTPLMALGSRVRLDREYTLMAERFATMADALVLTGDLAEQPECTDTADGRPLTRRCAAARVVRMIGGDLDLLDMNDAVTLAQQFRTMALDRLTEAARRITGDHAPDRVILSGSGITLAALLAQTLWPHAEHVHLAHALGAAASAAACAHALLRLWELLNNHRHGHFSAREQA